MAGQWYYTVDSKQQGPVDWDDLARLARRGDLLPSDMIWQEGLANWVKANTTPGLFDEAGRGSGSRGRRLEEDEAPRRSRRDNPDDDYDRPRRARSDDDAVDDPDRPRRRRPKQTGMPVGLKVGIIVGSVVVGLLVVGVVLFLLMRPGESLRATIDVPAGAGGVVRADTLKNSDGNDRRNRGPCHVYQVRMNQGRTYTIDMETGSFDAFLRLENSNSIELAQNDDFMGLNSRIVFVAPNTGTYRIIATSLGGNGRGAYTLRIREGIHNNFNNMFR